MPLPDPHLPGHELETLYHLAQRVADPCDYFHGRGQAEGPLPGSILCFTRRKNSWLQPDAKPSQHHRYVLIAAVQGAGRARIDSDTFPLGPGEAQIVCPFQYHSYADVLPRDICWVFVTFEMARPDLLEPLRSKPSIPMGPMELLLLGEILECWLRRADGELLAWHLGLLIRRLGSVSAAARPAPQAQADLVARVNGYILPRLNEPFRLKELGAALGESESHLRACFRRLTGESLGRHIRQMRLRKACQLLLDTGSSITEIAEQCGYDSVYTFSQSFKTNCGVSPRAYRESSK